MTPNTRKSGIRSRAMGAALVTLGCSLGVTVPLHAAKSTAAAATSDVAVGAPVVEKPLTAEQIKLLSKQYKLSADYIKLVEADNAQLAADQQKLAAYEASLTADQVKLKSNQEKLHAMHLKIEADQQKLSGHFIKVEIEAAPAPKTTK